MAKSSKARSTAVLLYGEHRRPPRDDAKGHACPRRSPRAKKRSLATTYSPAIRTTIGARRTRSVGSGLRRVPAAHDPCSNAHVPGVRSASHCGSRLQEPVLAPLRTNLGGEGRGQRAGRVRLGLVATKLLRFRHVAALVPWQRPRTALRATGEQGVALRCQASLGAGDRSFDKRRNGSVLEVR